MSAVMKIGGHPLAGNSKKVYQCVPVSEAHQVHQIVQSVRLDCGLSDRKIIEESLVDLVDLGLIKRVGLDRYQRRSLQDYAAAASQSAKAPAGAPPVEAKIAEGSDIDAHEMLVQIGEEVRSCASHFASRFKLLADRVDDAAAALREREGKDAEALDKLRQLQSLLKGL